MGYCANLKEINVSPDNSYYCSVDGVLYTKDMSKIFQCPAGLSGEFTILDSITTIGESACTCCPLLTSIDIPDNVTSIGEHAFWSCSSLTSMNIPDSVTTIGSGAFSNCSSLTDVIIRNSECNFDDRDDIFPDTTTIHGYNNSTAQEYAEQHNMNFVSLDDVSITTTTTTTESTTSTTTSTTTTKITEKIIGHIASDEELFNCAINDYQIKTCITAAYVDINEN